MIQTSVLVFLFAVAVATYGEEPTQRRFAWTAESARALGRHVAIHAETAAPAGNDELVAFAYAPLALQRPAFAAAYDAGILKRIHDVGLGGTQMLGRVVPIAAPLGRATEFLTGPGLRGFYDVRQTFTQFSEYQRQLRVADYYRINRPSFNSLMSGGNLKTIHDVGLGGTQMLGRVVPIVAPLGRATEFLTGAGLKGFYSARQTFTQFSEYQRQLRVADHYGINPPSFNSLMSGGNLKTIHDVGLGGTQMLERFMPGVGTAGRVTGFLTGPGLNGFYGVQQTFHQISEYNRQVQVAQHYGIRNPSFNYVVRDVGRP